MPSPTSTAIVSEEAPDDDLYRLHQDLFFQLVRAYDCVTSEQSKFCQQFEITPQQFNVLKVLAAKSGDGSGIACQAIGEQLLNRVPDITRLLDRLEQAGLIVRERCCEDRRVVRTQLTDAGRAKVDEMCAPLSAAVAARFGHMSRQELVTLAQLLNKLRGHMCGSDGGCETDHAKPAP